MDRGRLIVISAVIRETPGDDRHSETGRNAVNKAFFNNLDKYDGVCPKRLVAV